MISSAVRLKQCLYHSNDWVLSNIPENFWALWVTQPEVVWQSSGLIWSGEQEAFQNVSDHSYKHLQVTQEIFVIKFLLHKKHYLCWATHRSRQQPEESESVCFLRLSFPKIFIWGGNFEGRSCLESFFFTNILLNRFENNLSYFWILPLRNRSCML